MEPQNEFGKLLVIGGVLIVLIGIVLWSGFGKNFFGRLPGDVHYSRGNFSFHFPIVTCLVLSIILTVAMWLFRRPH